ncbi:MAG: hypothetical protein LBT54_02410, partial [Bifidobacteriaceae bacterium]|nr:hypothetical protein [Bifidobacteriaceae bacterium]
MAARTKAARPVRTLVTLFIVIAAVGGTVAAGVQFSDASYVPGFALDLQGGTQLILQPIPEGNRQPTSEDVSQAVAIIRQRIDAAGVAE